MDPVLVEAQFIHRLIITCVSGSDRLRKSIQIGTETKSTITSDGIEILLLPNDEKNSDEHICSSSKYKPPKAYLQQSRLNMRQHLQLISVILLSEYEDVLKAR